MDQWKRILASEGFRTMVPSLVNGQQHIILAESNGVIRKNKPIDEQPKRVESRQKQVPVSSTQSTKMEDTLHSACVAYIKRLVGGYFTSIIRTD
ncbi:hypothetical protein [Gracilibacillus sp. JCM 18860]|uniref:hypothetical protein n=1 Tax=Gracilibacillus sp. JCM 18860 TaxID=1306159 RepID=UPI0006D1CFF9